MSPKSVSKSKSGIPSKWSWHYRALQELRSRLAGEWMEHKQDSAVPPDRDRMGFAGTASDIAEHDVLAAELALEKNMLHEVDGALSRINDGSYGICEVSGKPIPAARLRALPWTRYTREAAEQREKSLRSA